MARKRLAPDFSEIPLCRLPAEMDDTFAVGPPTPQPDPVAEVNDVPRELVRDLREARAIEREGK